MPWIKFTKTFPWSPVKGQTILYKPGMKMLVTTACFAQVMRAGAGEQVSSPASEKAEAEVKAKAKANPEPDVIQPPAPEISVETPTKAPRVRKKADGENQGQKSGATE